MCLGSQVCRLGRTKRYRQTIMVCKLCWISITFRGVQQAVCYLPNALLLMGARGLWGFLGGRPPSPALSPVASDDASRACAHSILLTNRIQFANHVVCWYNNTPHPPPHPPPPPNLFRTHQGNQQIATGKTTYTAPTMPLTHVRCCEQGDVGILSTHK